MHAISALICISIKASAFCRAENSSLKSEIAKSQTAGPGKQRQDLRKQ